MKSPTKHGSTASVVRIPLDHAAHARAGDKGNRSNVCVIAWHPDLWPLLVAQVTEEAVASQFASRRPASVTRYLLPRLQAMNFVLDEALDGGVNNALNLDSHGKSLSYLLLQLEIDVPLELLDRLVGQAELRSLLPALAR